MTTQVPLSRILAIIISAMSIGCSDGFNARPRSEYDVANSEITRGHYNVAIATMSAKLQDDSSDSEARLILASAYAARAGIFMRQYFDVGTRVIAKLRQADDLWARNSANLFDRLEASANNSNERELFSVIARLYRASEQVNELIGIFELIPNLSEENKRDLIQAVDILSGEQSYTAGPALYRGLLRLVLLKNKLPNEYSLATAKKCVLNPKALVRQLSLLRQDVANIMSDFIAGSLLESKATELVRASAQLNLNFNAAITAISKLDSTGVIDLTELNSRLGVKCAQ